MAKTLLKPLTPVTKKRAVAPLRRPNSELRSREHLTETEVAKLIEAARGNRYGHRDATMILAVCGKTLEIQVFPFLEGHSFWCVRSFEALFGGLNSRLPTLQSVWECGSGCRRSG